MIFLCSFWVHLSGCAKLVGPHLLAAKPRLQLFNLLMTTDCSKIAVTESAETTVHHYLSIVHPATDFLMVCCETVTICTPAVSLIRLRRFFEVAGLVALSSRRSTVSRRCWRRAPPRKAATYQLMAPSQSAVSFPHR